MYLDTIEKLVDVVSEMSQVMDEKMLQGIYQDELIFEDFDTNVDLGVEISESGLVISFLYYDDFEEKVKDKSFDFFYEYYPTDGQRLGNCWNFDEKKMVKDIVDRLGVLLKGVTVWNAEAVA